MAADAKSDKPEHRGNEEGALWSIMGYLLSGLLIWGGIGWAQHGQKGAKKIDTYLAHFNDRIFLLAKIPRDVMKQIFEPEGGVLKTHFKGPRNSLIQLPTLTKYLDLKETDDPKPIESVFATEYTKKHLEYTRAVHYQILQDLVRLPGLGISLGPIAAWTS